MIRRFVAVSVFAHALAASLLAGYGLRPLTIAAPELRVSLGGKMLSSVRLPGNEATKADTMRSAVPLLTDTQSTSAVAVAPPDHRMARTEPEPEKQDDVLSKGGEQLANHLLTALRAAIDARFTYPPMARRQGWQGQVQIGLTITADGRLSELHILRSSGYAILDLDAIQTLARVASLPQARAWLEGRSRQLQLPIVYRLIES